MVAKSTPKKVPQEVAPAKEPESPAPVEAATNESSSSSPTPPAVSINERPLLVIEFEAYETTVPSDRIDADFVEDLLFAIEKEKVRRILVQGHSDNSGTEPLNIRLSRRRAASISRLLVDLGVPETLIKTEGVGAQQPRSANSTATGRAQNRRVEIKTTYQP